MGGSMTRYHGALRLASEAARSSGRRSKVLLMPLGTGVGQNNAGNHRFYQTKEV